jgi:protein tyrosine phosphatase (PTP) superfamily phosphohydrolase (DUF442 family)
LRNLLLSPYFRCYCDGGAAHIGTIAGDRSSRGFRVVINLGLKDADYALPDEQGLVESLGLIYEPIPVLWEQPTTQNFERFTDCMNCHKDKKLFVHCAANKRVSVFVALYRILEQSLSSEQAFHDLDAVWKPNEI